MKLRIQTQLIVGEYDSKPKLVVPQMGLHAMARNAILRDNGLANSHAILYNVAYTKTAMI